MQTSHLCAALISALLHAAWNAAVKANASPREAMTAQMLAAALLALLLLVVLGLPPQAAWPWVGLSTLLNVAAVRALLRAYDGGGFGVVYPMARATSVLGVAAVAPLVVGEHLGVMALLGIALIATALLVLAHDSLRQPSGGTTQPLTRRALGWTLLSGALTAAYVLADARGVRASGSGLAAALSYGCTVSVTNALAMGWLMRDAGRPDVLLRRHWRMAACAAVASTASYLLILWVYQRAAVAPASALRDTSALFAMVIAVWWLKEAMPARRLAALALALAALPLLRLG